MELINKMKYVDGEEIASEQVFDDVASFQSIKYKNVDRE
jgi:hypothetical protein